MRLTTLILLLLSATHGYADALVQLPAPAHAEPIEQQTLEQAERSYPLAALRRISNQLRTEQQVTAEGRLHSRTYRLASGHRSTEAFEAARQALLADAAEPLFWCEGRECGSSSLWANAIFGNAQLYGPDDQQAFLLLRLAAPQQDSLLALYAITRGNRRAYLHAELLESAQPLGELLPSAATLLRELKSSGTLSLRNLPQTPQAPWSQLLARSLSLDSTLRVSLSGAQAEAWLAALRSEGVPERRLSLGETTGAGLRLALER